MSKKHNFTMPLGSDPKLHREYWNALSALIDAKHCLSEISITASDYDTDYDFKKAALELSDARSKMDSVELYLETHFEHHSP